MKIKFLVDFRGRETGERYFQAGDEWGDCEPAEAERLIVDGRAEPVIDPEPEQPEAAPVIVQRKRKGK